MAPTTGTRLGARRKCQTRHDWQMQQEEAQKVLSQMPKPDRSRLLPDGLLIAGVFRHLQESCTGVGAVGAGFV